MLLLSQSSEIGNKNLQIYEYELKDYRFENNKLKIKKGRLIK